MLRCFIQSTVTAASTCAGRRRSPTCSATTGPTARAAAFKIAGEACPLLPAGGTTTKKLPLSDYQTVASQLALGQDGFALFMEQGTGKTPTVIRRICVEGARDPENMYRALIVCPPQVVYNWTKELERFATSPGRWCRSAATHASGSRRSFTR